MAIIYRYNVVTRTIVIDTTSTIKLDINGFNRVLNISSSTEKGAKLIEETNLLDQSIDTAIYKIIEYANENQMVKSTGIVVTVTGKELKHNSLEKTEDFIYRKNLKVRFNNSGLEHKVNQNDKGQAFGVFDSKGLKIYKIKTKEGLYETKVSKK